MMILFALLNTSTAVVEETSFRAPYIVGGGILLVLFVLIFAVMSFGKGREHS